MSAGVNVEVSPGCGGRMEEVGQTQPRREAIHTWHVLQTVLQHELTVDFHVTCPCRQRSQPRYWEASVKDNQDKTSRVLGPCHRKSKLENLVTAGKFDDKKGPGRPRTSYLTSVKTWLDLTANENIIIQPSATRERERERERERDGAKWSPKPGPGMATDDDCFEQFIKFYYWKKTSRCGRSYIRWMSE